MKGSTQDIVATEATIIFPDDDHDRAAVTSDLITFSYSPQLQSVEDLHIVMQLFWESEFEPLGYLRNASEERAHPHLLKYVLNSLKEAKAGKDGPLLRTLTLEDLSEWRPDGRRDRKREDHCLAQYQKMAQDAGIETLQWTWPEGSGSKSFRKVEDRGNVNVVEEEVLIQSLLDGGNTRVTLALRTRFS